MELNAALAASRAIDWPLILDAGAEPTPCTVSALAPGCYDVTPNEKGRCKIEFSPTARISPRSASASTLAKAPDTLSSPVIHLALARMNLPRAGTLYAQHASGPSRADAINAKVVFVLASEAHAS